MKRYLLFSGEENYPRRGWSDFIDDFDKLQTAKKYGHKILENDEFLDWIQVVEVDTKQVVYFYNAYVYPDYD